MTEEDQKIRSLAETFTTSVLESIPQGEMQGTCLIMCYLLWQYLGNKDCRNRIIEGKFKVGAPHETPHFWLKLDNDLIIDPTMKQFCDKTPCRIIKQFCEEKFLVYLGAKPKDFSADNDISERAHELCSSLLIDYEVPFDPNDPTLNAQQKEGLLNNIKTKKAWLRMAEKANRLNSPSGARL